MTKRFWRWGPPPRPFPPGLDRVEVTAEATGALAALRAMQNELVAVFDDVAVNAEGNLTFYGKRGHATFVPLVTAHVGEVAGGVVLELDPEHVARALNLDPAMTAAFKDSLPVERAPSQHTDPARLRLVFRDQLQVRALTDALARRFLHPR